MFSDFEGKITKKWGNLKMFKEKIWGNLKFFFSTFC